MKTEAARLEGSRTEVRARDCSRMEGSLGSSQSEPPMESLWGDGVGSIRPTTARLPSWRGSTPACASGTFATRLPFTRSAISCRRPIRTPVPTCSNAETREGSEFGTKTPTTTCKSAGVTNNVEIDDRGLILRRGPRGWWAAHPEAHRVCEGDRDAVCGNALAVAYPECT